MTGYVALPNSAVQTGGRPRGSTVTALRDNPISIAEVDSTAPVNQREWHPYNKVTNGDANDGKFYDQSIDGSVASVVTPDFADGYEYRARFLGNSLTGAANFTLELYEETSAAYGTAFTLVAAGGAGDVFSGWAEILAPRTASNLCSVPYAMAIHRTTNGVQAFDAEAAYQDYRTTSQKRLRARVAASAGNIDLGKMYLDRRRIIT